MKIFWGTVSIMFVFAVALVAFAHNSTPSSAVEPESPASASALYAQHCAKCHGRDGRAKGIKAKTKGTRNITDPEWQDRVSDERIFNTINNGKGRMPGFGKKLSELDVEALVQFVRGLRR